MEISSRSFSNDNTRSLLRMWAEKRQTVKEFAKESENEVHRFLQLLTKTCQKLNEERKSKENFLSQLAALKEKFESLRQEVWKFEKELLDARAEIATLSSQKCKLEMDLIDAKRKCEMFKERSNPHVNRTRSGRGGVTKAKRAAAAGSTARFSDIEHHMSEISFDDKAADNTEFLYRSETDEEFGNVESGYIIRRPPESAEIGRPSMQSCMKICSYATILNGRQAKKKDHRAVARNVITPSDEEDSVLDLTHDDTPFACAQSWTNGAPIESRKHTFANFQLYEQIFSSDECDVCSRHLGIVSKSALKCTDCNLHIHKSCKKEVRLPCIPFVAIPQTPRKERPRLRDLCPQTQPEIPPIVIHCVIELEKSRLNTKDLYLIPGNESEIENLLDDFKNARFQSRLKLYGTEVITSCIKRFLEGLRDTVIPQTSWEEFVNAVEADDMKRLDAHIRDLPLPNRDTLSFLCAHFQKVCANSTENKMTPKKLAKAVATTIVAPAPIQSKMITIRRGAQEFKKRVMVMLALLKMPADYWPKFYMNFPANRSPVVWLQSCMLSSSNRGKQQDEEKTSLKSSSSVKNTGRNIAFNAVDRSLLRSPVTPSWAQTPKNVYSVLKRSRFVADR